MCVKRSFLKVGDLILFAVIALAGVLILLLFVGNDHTMVTVTQNGEQLYRFDLSDAELEGKEYVIDGKYKNTICIKGGKLFMSEASCPDGLCTKSLPLTEKGGVICCVPNGVIVTARAESADWDVVIQ